MSPTIDFGAPAEELPLVRDGRLPSRYGHQMQDELYARVLPLLFPGATVLDVGAGRHPTIAPRDRPEGCRYVGLDISGEELQAAGSDSYDQVIVADITSPLGRDHEFDVIVSWQVLEHVSPLAASFESLRECLRPGGTLLAQLTGSYAAFALAGRLLPHSVRVRAATRLLGHRGEEKFPVRYDRSNFGTLLAMLEPWSEATIVPFYRGATYFSFSRLLTRAYLAYESAIERRRLVDFATHYLVIAKR